MHHEKQRVSEHYYIFNSKGEHLEQERTSWPAPISSKGKALGSHIIS